MKKIFLLTGIITLLTATGCIVPEGERHEHENAGYDRHPEVMVEHPAVEVRPAEVIVR